MQLQEIESGGVMSPAKWAAQFISDMSLHIVNEDYDALEQIKARSDQIEGIRATLLVNFGEGAGANKFGFSVKDEGTTHALMVEVLERLTKDLADDKERLEIATKLYARALGVSADEAGDNIKDAFLNRREG